MVSAAGLFIVIAGLMSVSFILPATRSVHWELIGKLEPMIVIVLPLASALVFVKVETSVFIQTGFAIETLALALLAGFAAGIRERVVMARKAEAMILVLLGVLVASAAAQGATVKVARAANPVQASGGEAAPGNGLISPGFLSTDGNQIVDSSGKPQRLACAGYNEPGPDIPGDLAGMKRAGFNCARYPFDEGALKSTFPIMDAIVAAAAPLGMKVIFDHHVDDAEDLCGGQQQNGLWFDVGDGTDNTDGCGNKGTTTPEKFKADWVTVARHYAGNSTVIAFDLDNEPLVLGLHATPITWGTGGPTDILEMWEDVGSAIEVADPGVLIVGECPVNYSGKLLNGRPEGTKGIMDCSQAQSRPVVLKPAAPKFVYSIHDYPNIGTDNEGPSTPDRNAAFGFLEMENIAPVWIGEMGSSLDQPHSDGVTVRQQSVWAAALAAYLNGKAPGGPTFTGSQQPFGTDWWAWGDLTGQTPDGTLQGANLRPAQFAIYSQFRFVNKSVPAHRSSISAAPSGRDGYLPPKGWLTARDAQIVDERERPVRMQVIGKIVDCASVAGLQLNFDHHPNDCSDHGWGGEQTDGTLESDWSTPRPDQKGITEQLIYLPRNGLRAP